MVHMVLYNLTPASSRKRMHKVRWHAATAGLELGPGLVLGFGFWRRLMSDKATR